MATWNDPYGPYSQNAQRAEQAAFDAHQRQQWAHEDLSRQVQRDVDRLNRYGDSPQTTGTVSARSGGGDALLGLLGGGILLYLATRLDFEVQLKDGGELLFCFFAFVIGAAQFKASGQTLLGFVFTAFGCWGLTYLDPSWASWPWYAWVTIWIGGSWGITTVLNRSPKLFKAAGLLLLLGFLGAGTLVILWDLGVIHLPARDVPATQSQTVSAPGSAPTIPGSNVAERPAATRSP